MRKIIANNLLVGFGFGVVFSIIGYMQDVRASATVLFAIPFMVAILCAAGGLVATMVITYLSRHFTLGERTQHVVGFIVAGIFNSAIILGLMTYSGQLIWSRQMFVGGLLGLIMGGIYAVYRFTTDKLTERMEFLSALTERNLQLQEASRRLAIVEERNRMGRELHDSVSQGLHGLVFALHSLRQELEEPSPKAAAIMDHMDATAQATLDELRTMIDELKPSLLAEQGLEQALRTVGELFSQRIEVPVEYHFNLTHPLPPVVESTVYRITQEGLANIERHSGATHVSVKLDAAKDGQAYLTITDNGRGFDSKALPTGNGLNNMRQRAEELGGRLKVISKIGLGTTLHGEFPLKAES